MSHFPGRLLKLAGLALAAGLSLSAFAQTTQPVCIDYTPASITSPIATATGTDTATLSVDTNVDLSPPFGLWAVQTVATASGAHSFNVGNPYQAVIAAGLDPTKIFQSCNGAFGQANPPSTFSVVQSTPVFVWNTNVTVQAPGDGTINITQASTSTTPPPTLVWPFYGWCNLLGSAPNDSFTETYNIVTGGWTFSERGGFCADLTAPANVIPNQHNAAGDAHQTENWNSGATGTLLVSTSSTKPLAITVPTALQLPPGVWKDPSTLAFNTYEAALLATGGHPPYDWTVTGLPIGISVNPTTGVISGTFSQGSEDVQSFDRINGLFNVSATVSDSAGATDTVSLAIPFTCGGSGDEDSLIGQYATRLGSTPTFGQYGIRDIITGKAFAPRCMDTTRSASSRYYSFNNLNVSNQQPAKNQNVLPQLALLANSLLTGQGVTSFLPPPLFSGPGLDAWVANCGSVPILTSGYRNPADQLSVYLSMTPPGTPARGGRHMFGDAADLAVSPPGTDPNTGIVNPAGVAAWNAMLNAALNAGADFTESDPISAKAGLPCSSSKMRCVHADWRFATQPFSSGGTPYAQ
jgi:hypothetical protein